MRLNSYGLLLVAACLSVGQASATSFSFQGTFAQDDQLQLFQFTAPSASVILRTWGYAGGTNALGAIIPAGGFDPVLSLFDATGGLLPTSPLVATNNDGAGVATDLATGLAADSLLSLTTLNAGHTYVLVLSQFDNLPNGPNYGNGFSNAGLGNFTPGEFGCGGTSFCDASASQRTGDWAVDITGVREATDITGGGVPEPGTVLLFATGLAGIALARRRKNRHLV